MKSEISSHYYTATGTATGSDFVVLTGRYATEEAMAAMGEGADIAEARRVPLCIGGVDVKSYSIYVGVIVFPSAVKHAHPFSAR